MACSNPTMAMGMPLFWIKSTMLSKMSSRSGVEAQDEAAHHLHAVTLDGGYAVKQAAPRVLQLIGGDQPRLIGVSMPGKPNEAGILHQLHQFRIVGQVQ